MTQAQIVLDYLNKHEGLTQLEATLKLGITRLGARIFELKKQGVDIKKINITKKTPYGTHKTYAKYYLKN